VLDVDLDGLAWDVNLAAPRRAGTVAFLGDAGNAVLPKDPPDRRRRQGHGMIAAEEQPQAGDAVLAFLPDAKHQRLNVRRRSMRADARTGQPGSQPVEPLALVPSAPFVEESARDPKEPTGTADIVANLFKVLKHAQAGRRPLGALPVPNYSLHPGPPFASTLEGIDSVRASP
jgi:hypothetical protein